MSSRVLLSGGVKVHYGQFYISPPHCVPVDLAEAFRGQENGICGAAQEGQLFLITGLHTGLVRLAVTMHDTKPPVDESWEEVVEVPFVHRENELLLKEWGSDDGYELFIPPGTYRVRYCARTMLGDWQIFDENAAVQTYALDFWPAPTSGDAIIKVTGECASYWHSFDSSE